MAIVGRAEVVVTAVTAQLEAGVQRSLQNIKRDVESSGVADTIQRSVAGDGQSPLEDVEHEVSNSLKRMERDADDGGNNIANSIRKAGNFGSWASILKIGFLAAAISVAVAAIANLVAGLFAMISAAAPAAVALVGLIPLISGLGVAIGTAVLAFGGIGGALKALGQQEQQAGASAKQHAAAQQAAADRVIAARQAVARAERSLADAQQRAADDRVSGAHEVAQAELSLADAQRNEKQAQADLIQARKDAAHQLIDLQFQVRQTAITEREAALALADAQEAYNSTISDPRSTARAVEDAGLRLQQAQLALDEASDKRDQTAAAQAEAAKKGVEGSDKVVAAVQRVKDAHQSTKDAEYNLAQTRHQNAEQAVNDQQSITDATQGVANAQRDLTRALQAQVQASEDAGAAASKMKDAFKDLSPQAADFARYLFSLKGEVKDLRAAAGEELFPKLKTGIQELVKNFFPTLKDGLRVTGGAIGDFFTSITHGFLSTPLFQRQFGTLVQANAGWIRKFGDIFAHLGKAVTTIAVAAIPMVNRFVDWLDRLSVKFDNFTAAKSVGGADSPMVKFFKMVGDRAALLGSIIGNIIGIFFNLGKGADDTGVSLLKTFDRVTEKVSKGLGTPEGQAKLKNFFAAVEPGFKALGSLLAAIGGAFIRLATNPGIKTVADQLRTQILPMLERLIGYLVANIVPKIVPILADIGRVIEGIVKSGVIETVVDDLGKVIRAIADFASNPVVTFLIGKLGHLFAALLVFTVVKKMSFLDEAAKGLLNFKRGLSGTISEAALAKSALGKVATGFREITLAQQGAKQIGGKLSLGQKITAFASGVKAPSKAAEGGATAAEAAVGNVLSKGGAFARVGAAMTATLEGIGGAFAALLSPIGLIVLAIGAVVAAFVYAYKTSAIVRDNVKKILEGLSEAFHAFLDPIIHVLKDVFVQVINAFGGHVGNFGEAMHKTGDFVRKAFEVITGAIVKAMPVIKTVMGIIGTIIATTIKVTFAIVIPIVKFAIKTIIEVIKFMVPIIKGIFEVVKGIIIGVWWAIKNIVIPIVKIFWSAIKLEFQIAVAIIKGVIDVIKAVITGAWDFISTYVLPVVKVLWDGIVIAFKVAWAILEPIINVIKSVITGAWSFISDYILPVISGIWTFITNAFKVGKETLGSTIDLIKGVIMRPFNWIKEKVGGIVGDIVGFITSIPDKIMGLGKSMFDAGKNLIQSLWNGLKDIAGFVGDIAKGFVNGIIGFINDKIIKNLNNALEIDLKVHGIGIHIDPPDIPSIPKLATGGILPAIPGGALYVGGEGGRRERVEPLDPSGLSRRDRAIIESLAASLTGGKSASSGANIQIDVHPAPGMDEREVALQTSRELGWRLGLA